MTQSSFYPFVLLNPRSAPLSVDHRGDGINERILPGFVQGPFCFDLWNSRGWRENMELGDIGARIRKERKTLGLTLEKFAKLAGTSKAMLQRVETGVKSPSISLLAEIAPVCRRRIDDFIIEEPEGFYKLDGRKQKAVKAGEYEIRIIAPFGLISRDLVVNHFKAKAGALVKPRQEDGYVWVYIIKGTCLFEHDGVPHKLKKGDVIYYDSRRPHALRVLTALETIRITVRT